MYPVVRELPPHSPLGNAQGMKREVTHVLAKRHDVLFGKMQKSAL